MLVVTSKEPELVKAMVVAAQRMTKETETRHRVYRNVATDEHRIFTWEQIGGTRSGWELIG